MVIPSRYQSLLWMAGFTLIAAEGVAFWLLCGEQVDKGQARRAQWQAVQVAFGDCLETVDGATIASCRRQALTGR